MVRKKLAAAILAISAMQAGWVSALGLGEATLKSSLNQPLVAEIYINDLGDLSADQLVVKMASAEDFSRAGVERAFFLTGIKFDVRMDGRGGGVVRLITREPVNEPYLNFVIEARWPTGRMLREYTLLLDLPVFSQGGTGAIDSASTSAVGAAIELADQAPETAVYDRPRRISRTTGESGASAPAGDGQHRVEADETLWRIATNNRPQGATVKQTVVAIHRLNPEAFTNGNMNLLKAGAVLRLPTAADVEAIGEQDAAVEIARARNAQQTVSERGPDLDARAGEDAVVAAPAEESRLSIATPGEATSSDTAAKASSGASALRDQLGAAQENLDRVQREKAELENRVGDMERQMGTLQKILQLKEEQLNALQSQAEQSSAKSEEPFAAAVVAETVPAETVPAEVDTETAPTPAATAAKTEAPVVEPQAAPAQQTPAAPAEKSLIDQVMDNTAALFGVVVLGVGAIAALMYRRRKEAAEEKEVESLLATEEFAADALDTEAALASVSAERNEYTDAAPSIVAAPEAESAAPTTAQTSDPIAEADIYVAYGRYPQAIDLLQNAIRNEPVRSDFHVKLLEVYLETQDKEGFQAQFAQLQSLGDYAAIGRVKELMSAFDGVEGWLDTRDLIQDDDSDHDHEITDEALLSKGSYQSSTVFAEAHDHDDNGLALDLDTHDSIKAEEGLSLDLTDFETGNSGLHLDHDLTLDDELTADDELTVDANQANTLSFDESHLDLPSGEEVLAADLSFDDDLMHDDHAEKALAEEAPEFLADAESLPEFDGGFANDLERSLQDEGIENDPLALDKGIGQLEELGQLDELGELDEFDQALSELDTNADLASLDSEFGDLLDETTSDLALPETDASLELPSEFDAELPDTLDFSSSDELSSISESDDVALDAGIDLNNLGDLSAFESTAESEAVFDAAESSESDDFDFSDSDEVATKLDLARAYIDMGDGDGAKEILDEVMAEGNDEQKGQASELLARIA